MKKLEILKLIEANLKIDKTYSFLPWNDKTFPNWWFYNLSQATMVPKIEGLTNELNLLRQATKDIAKETKEAKELIENTDCKHEIRLHYENPYFSEHKCIFCGKIFTNNPETYWDPAELPNTYCINYESKYQDDGDQSYIVKGGHTKESLYNLITAILKDKSDDEEIDLVKEMKELNLKLSEYINIEIKPETFIMIIGGTNKQFIGSEAYITKPKTDIVKDLYTYFAGQIDTKLLVIDNADVITSIDNFSNVKKVAYSSIEELEKILDDHKQDFKLIIDISDLYDYKIKNKNITQKKHELDLKTMYPNSRVIKINNICQNEDGLLRKTDVKHILKLVNEKRKED